MTTSNIRTYMGEPVQAMCWVGTSADILLKNGNVITNASIRVDRSPAPAYSKVGECAEVRAAQARRPAPTRTPRNSLPEDDAKRAQYPMADGLIDYFPNALAEVSRVSFIGSQKHNKGEPMHWARDKSTDHRNKIARHLVDAGGVDEVVMEDGKVERVRHSAYLAWRALANLQEELEREEGYHPSRASRF